VLVTNGIYATGGRFVSGDMTNRVVLDKPLSVLGMNGPEQNVIEGQWDPVSTNGPLSVRCVWIGNGAIIGGFTLRNGSTPANGGGAWSAGVGLQDTIVGCVITNCRAAGNGGGAYRGRLANCIVSRNVAYGNGGGTALAIFDVCCIQNNSAVKDINSRGGGVYGGVARRCQILGNSSSGYGGGATGVSTGSTSQGGLLLGCAVAFNTAGYFAGAFDSVLYQCMVVSNTATAGPTGGVSFCDVWNSILYFNSGVLDAASGTNFPNAGGSATYHSVCTFPVRLIGSITNEPQLLDASHIAVTSPCRSAGTNFGIAGFLDIDGDPWLTNAPIGCDEVVESELIGPLGINLFGWPEIAVGGVFPLGATITGRASQLTLNFDDGTVKSNSVFGITHVWTNAGDYLITALAFNNDYPQGVSATLPVHVVPITNPTISSTTISASTFSLQFLSQAGLTYELDAVTNIVPPLSWQILKSLSSTGGVITATDTIGPSVQKFYRLKVQ
jgi:hypothetical protein